MKKLENRKYDISENIVSGKLYKSLKGDFDDDMDAGFEESEELLSTHFDKEASSHINSSADKSVKGEWWKVTKVLPCPIELDNPEIFEEISKPIEKASFSCNFKADFNLVSSPISHKHNVWQDINSPLDSEDNYVEFGSDFCGIYYLLDYEVEVSEVIKTGAETETLLRINELLPKHPEHSQESRKLEKSRKNFKQLNNYIEKHLESELKRALYKLATEYFTLHETKDDREENIKLLINDEEKELRKRLKIRKGRIPSVNQDVSDEKETFLGQCFETFEQIEKKRKKLNQTELVKVLFDRESNPHQTLRRKLKLFDLSFQDLLSKYSEQKSS